MDKMTEILPTSRIVRMIPNATSIVNEGYNPVSFHDSFSYEEKEHLLIEAIRRNIFSLALQDIAQTFQKNSEGYFDDPFKLNKEEMLQNYHLRLFSNVENIEDVAAFTAFLLHHQKIESDRLL